MTNRFVAKEAKVLVYGDDRNYYVCECNNNEQVAYAIENFGEPNLYMDGFKNWRELASAKRCYQDMLSAFPGVEGPEVKPTDEEEEWFWRFQLEHEQFYDKKRIARIIAKYDPLLPDEPRKRVAALV